MRKRLAQDAKDQRSSYVKYRKKVNQALTDGHAREAIIIELYEEIERITASESPGDAIYQQGVHNAKMSCKSAIRRIITELREEGGSHA